MPQCVDAIDTDHVCELSNYHSQVRDFVGNAILYIALGKYFTSEMVDDGLTRVDETTIIQRIPKSLITPITTLGLRLADNTNWRVESRAADDICENCIDAAFLTRAFRKVRKHLPWFLLKKELGNALSG